MGTPGKTLYKFSEYQKDKREGLENIFKEISENILNVRKEIEIQVQDA